KVNHHGKDHSHHKNRVSHNQHEKRAASPMALHREKANHSHHKMTSSSCNKHEKRAASPMALHRKSKKADHSHHRKASSSSCDA
ncbi:hypothetical protein BGZ96_004190, partial [Linnemannia gamsii]